MTAISRGPSDRPCTADTPCPTLPVVANRDRLGLNHDDIGYDPRANHTHPDAVMINRYTNTGRVHTKLRCPHCQFEWWRSERTADHYNRGLRERERHFDKSKPATWRVYTDLLAPIAEETPDEA